MTDFTYDELSDFLHLIKSEREAIHAMRKQLEKNEDRIERFERIIQDILITISNREDRNKCGI